MFDLSFIPSYKCNLKCWFCMYDCSPSNKEKLDIEKAKNFITDIDLSKINQFGFYGGEISIDLPLYQKFINIIPKNIPKFTITNGSWSRSTKNTNIFLDFISKNNIYTKVSSTNEHKKFQNQEVLIEVVNKRKYKDIIKIKENDDTKTKLLPMGRLSNQGFSCSLKCTKIPSDQPFRIALEPSGNIMFQNCDGIYPIVGNYKNR